MKYLASDDVRPSPKAGGCMNVDNELVTTTPLTDEEEMESSVCHKDKRCCQWGEEGVD